LFAGGGGASTGIERGLGRPVHIAINHNPKALSMHQANHPEAHQQIRLAAIDQAPAAYLNFNELEYQEIEQGTN
jgi:site-specific DNA-cytosine methylase